MKKSILVMFAAFILVSSIPLASALSIGVSPSERPISLEENTAGTVYFAVSQGSQENESISITTDATWLNAAEANFVLEPMGQKYVKFDISPLSAGEYTGNVKVSSSVGAMSSSVTSVVILTVEPKAKISEMDEKARNESWASILNAQGAIKNLRSIADTTNLDDILTNAMQEFDNGNYAISKNFADATYSLAIEAFGNANKEKTNVGTYSLFTVALIAVSSGLITLLLFVVYEMVVIRRSKKKISPGLPCARCGATTDMMFDGKLLKYYKCPKCGNEEVNFKRMEM